jgi:hypothetical protein
VASRYCTVTAPFWASLVMVLLILLIKTKAQLMSSLAVQRRTAEWVLQLVTILLIVGSALAFNRAENMVRAQDAGRKRLLTIPIHPGAGVDYSSLRAIHPQPRLILERFPFLKEHRLTIFRDESTGTPPAP